MLTANLHCDEAGMRRMIWGATLSTAAGLTALAFATSVHAAEPKFTPGPCAGDYSGVTNKIQCGTLTVDETRGGAGARRVALPVTIVKASAPKPGLPPVIYLHGGPGGGVVENLARSLRGPS